MNYFPSACSLKKNECYAHAVKYSSMYHAHVIAIDICDKS